MFSDINNSTWTTRLHGTGKFSPEDIYISERKT